MNCEKALLRQPPLDLATQGFDYAIFPPRADGKDKDTYVEKKEPLVNKNRQAKREAFMLCGMIKSINEALTYYKKHACGEHGNFEQTYSIHDDPTNY